MSVDFSKFLGTVDHSVTSLERDGKPAYAVTLTRAYRTTIKDLWDALTNPERLPRWFLPVEGTFQQGGQYQLTGNAGGTITLCEPPDRLELTWEFGGSVSWVEVRLSDEGVDGTRLTLSHIAHPDDHWNTFGPGAAGIGWDMALLGLSLHLDNPSATVDEEEFATSPEGRSFIRTGGTAWAEAHEKSGAEPSHARELAQRTTAFYLGETDTD